MPMYWFPPLRRLGLLLVVTVVLVSTAGPVAAPATGITVLNSPVAAGESLSFEVTDDADGTADVIQVWIDENGDGNFDTKEPRTTVTPSSPGATVAGTITVDRKAKTGTFQLMAREGSTITANDPPDVQTAFAVDNDPPTVTSITTHDRDQDGKIDAADVVFSEAIDDSSVRAADWDVAGVPAESVSTTVGGDADSDDDRIQVRIDTDANEVSGTAVADVTYRRGTTADLAGNLLARIRSGDVTETDGAGPALRAAVTADTNDDGDVDQIALTMSEPLDDGASTLDATAFTVGTGSVTGVSSGTANDDALTLTVSGVSGTNATPTVTQVASKMSDATGNTIATDRTITATDGASPRVDSITIRDRDEDGDIDAADVIFSEPVDDASVIPDDWTIGGQTASSVSTIIGTDTDVDDDRVQLQLGAGDEITGTAVAEVTYTADEPKDADVTDSAGNLLNDIAAGGVTETDGAAPSITAADTRDTDRDGDIDRVVVTFSEAVDDGTVTTDAFALGTGTVDSVDTGNAIDDDTANLSVSGLTGTAATPTVTLAASGVEDASGNARGTAQTFAGTTDGAPPVMTVATTQDPSVIGDVTSLAVTFSEPISDSASQIRSSSFTLDTGSVSGADTGDTANDDGIEVTVAGLTGTASTPQLTLVAGTIEDPTGLAVTTDQSITTTDGAPPAITKATTHDPDNNGKTDWVNVTFSEAIDDANSDLTAASFSLDQGSVDAVTTGRSSDDDTLNLSVSGVSTTPDVTVGANVIFDAAGNALGASQTFEASDTTAPGIEAARTHDLDRDGAVDNIDITLTEPIRDNPSTIDTTTFALDSGTVATVDTGTTGNDPRLDITVTGVSGTAITPNVTLVANKLEDAAGNALNGDQTFTATTDGAAPVVTAATVRDRNGNGTVDSADLTFSEPMNDSSVVANDWTIGALTVDRVTTTVGADSDVDDEHLRLELDGAGVRGTGVTNVTYSRDFPDDADTADPAGNRLATISEGDLVETDGAAPAIETATTADTDADGALDRIVVTLSEPIDDGTITGTAFSLGTGTVSAVDTGLAGDDDTVNLTVTGVGGTGATPTVTLASGTLADAAGNTLATDHGSTATDGAKPIVETITTRDRDGDGSVDAADVVFSEAVSDATVVPDDWTIGGLTVDTVTTTVNGDTADDDDRVQLRLAGTESPGTGLADVTYTRDTPTDADVSDLVGELLRNVESGDVTETDGAAPVVLNATTADETVDGNVDEIALTLSESIDDGASTLDATTITLDTGTVSDTTTGTSVDDDELTATVADLVGTAVSPNVTLQPNTLVDAAGNTRSTTQHVPAHDGAPPAIATATMIDPNSDDTVEAIRVTFSEDIDDGNSTLSTTTLSLSSGTVSAVDTDTVSNDDRANMTVDLTGVTTEVTVTLAAGAVADSSGNSLGGPQTRAATKLSRPLSLTARPSRVTSGGSVTFTVTRTDTGERVDATVTVDGSSGRTGADGETTLSFTRAGTFTATASKADTTVLNFTDGTTIITVTERSRSGGTARVTFGATGTSVTVTVDDARVGRPVSLPVEVTGDDDTVVLETVGFTPTRSRSFRLTATPSTAVPDGTPPLESTGQARSLRYFQLDHDASVDDIRDVSFTFRVRSTRLPRADVPVRLYRYADGRWRPLETRQLSETDEFRRYRAASPGFSMFAVGVVDSLEQTTSTPARTVTASTPTRTSLSGTTEPHPTTAGPARTPSHTESPAGSPPGPFDGVWLILLVLGSLIVLAVLLLGGRRWWRGRRIDQDTDEKDESTDSWR